MARRRKTHRSEETSDFSNDLSELLQKPKKNTFVTPTVTHTSPKSYRLIEDRRTYHPQGPNRAAASIHSPTHRLVIPTHPKAAPGNKKRSTALPRTVQFEAPKQVLVCIRRNQRKQVLFALNKTGKGSRAKRHRQSYYSSIRC